MIIIGSPRATTMGSEKVIAIKHKVIAAIIRLCDDNSPLAFMRLGPSLLFVSAPFIPSKASLKKLVATCMHSVDRRIDNKRTISKS